MSTHQNDNPSDQSSSKTLESLERYILHIRNIRKPFDGIVRITGTISPNDVELLKQPNVAVRIEVEKNEEDQPVYRIYTIRDFDPNTNLVEIDCVYHEGESPAMKWLEKMKAGSTANMIGLRQHFVPDYEAGGKVLFFADDSAIPALYSILKKWPDHAPALVHVDCANTEAADELPRVAGVEMHIHVRPQNVHAGTAGSLVRAALEIDDATNCQIWAACEREEARAIRKHFMNDCNIAKDRIKAIGYWRKGVTSSEMETARMKYYVEHISKGKSKSEFDEFELPV